MPTPALTAAQNAARHVYDWTGVKLTREQTAQILYQAGFRGQNLINMVAIAGRESGYRSGIHGTASPKASVSGDRGLFGINYSNDKALKAAGIIKNPQDLFDPLVNARAAFFLSKGGTNLFPWGSMKGGWAAGGDPFYGTDRTKAAAAVQNASNQGLLGKDWAGSGVAAPAAAAAPAVAQKVNANAQPERDAFNTYLQSVGPDQASKIVNSLRSNMTLGELGQYMNTAPAEVKRYIGFLSTLDTGGQNAEKNMLAAPDPQGSREMTSMLQSLGVSYPNAPNPTPALLAFLRGVGLNMSTAEDVKRRALERIGAATSDAMADIDRTAGRTKQNITGDLVRRNILSSGESNTRYARQEEDVANQRSDVQRTAANTGEDVTNSYNQSVSLARQQALDRVIGAEQDQSTARAMATAQEDAYRRQQTASENANAQSLAAQQQANQAHIDAIQRGAAQGVAL